MAPSQRFGLAFGLTPKQRKTLAEAFGNRLEDALAPFAGFLTASPALDPVHPHGSLILSESGPIFDVAVAIQEAAWPASLQFAVIVAPPGGAAGRDEAVRSKASVTLHGMTRHQAFRFDLPSKSEDDQELADAAALLHRTLVLSWTKTRWQAVRSYRRHGRQAQVARDLEISQQAVSQMLMGAHFRKLKVVEDAFRRWLGKPQRTMLWPMRSR